VLRSRSPELVQQAIWGNLFCHYAIRPRKADVAAHSGHDPDRLIVVAALRITRQSVAQQGAFPRDGQHANEHHWQAFTQRLLRRLKPLRRLRAAPRVVKREMPKWHVSAHTTPTGRHRITQPSSPPWRLTERYCS